MTLHMLVKNLLMIISSCHLFRVNKIEKTGIYTGLDKTPETVQPYGGRY